MPITVIVRAGTPSDARLTFDGNQRVVIGRGAGSDVRLPEASVSHRHATLRAQGADFVVVDEGSSNGTYVGEVRVAPHTSRIVRSGDRVRVGRIWLELRLEAAPSTRDVAAATRELALALVADAMAKAGTDPTLRVRVVEGPDAGAALPLAEGGRAYLVGRGPHCDLVLADADASREHVQVAIRDGAVSVRDLGGKNGTFLGEGRVPSDREVPWRPATMVRVARSVLALEDPVGLALSELERAPDEPLPEGEAPRSPDAPAPAAVDPSEPAPSGTTAGPPAPAAPVVAVAVKAAARKRESRWSLADKLVMAAAVVVLALSLGGLVWLLRG